MEFAKHIHTQRLSLRPLTPGDFYFFCRLHRNRDVRSFLGGPVRLRDLYPRFRCYLAKSEDLVWIAELAKSRRAIGLVELGPHKDGQNQEISYQFDPRVWGRGFADEALSAVPEHALSEVGLEQVIAETQRANAASRRLLERQGMVELKRLIRFGKEQVIFTTKSSSDRHRCSKVK